MTTMDTSTAETGEKMIGRGTHKKQPPRARSLPTTMNMNMQNSPHPTGPLATLPVELLQHVFLHLLLSCLHDTEQGTRLLHLCVHALTSISKTTRANVMAVLRMVRKEIAVGGDLVEYCARPWEMRVLVLTLDYKFSSPYWARLRVERYREVKSMRRAQERAEREGKRLQLKMNGGTVLEEAESSYGTI